ncbi:hypothetical protein B296_00002881 [Ensete ventricosum]|uniref:Uncharacterized protein n=1 Tax=Ensete ventricosum TaxID=4639 RepID=A0A427BA42_ENSVE|nr:hypothetical protein B296_00002881 [Ensete ventricosum]
MTIASSAGIKRRIWTTVRSSEHHGGRSHGRGGTASGCCPLSASTENEGDRDRPQIIRGQAETEAVRKRGRLRSGRRRGWKKERERRAYL